MARPDDASRQFRVASRYTHLVLYDPAAIPPDFPSDPDVESPEPKPPPTSAVTGLAADGRALVIHVPEGDCEASMRVVLDEDMPLHIRERGTVLVEGAPLTVPGGTLRADGVEFVQRPGETRPAAAGASLTIPTGEYLVDVIELVNWKLKNQSLIVSSGTTRLDRALHRLRTIYTWVGILMIPANVLGAPMLLIMAWQTGGWRRAAAMGLAILAVDAVLLAGFWTLQALEGRVPAWSRVGALQDAFEREHPDVTIVLTRTRPQGAVPAAPAFADLTVR